MSNQVWYRVARSRVYITEALSGEVVAPPPSPCCDLGPHIQLSPGALGIPAVGTWRRSLSQPGRTRGCKRSIHQSSAGSTLCNILPGPGAARCSQTPPLY